MKAILEFELPDDELIHIQCVEVEKAFSAIYTIEAFLMRRYKHTNPKSDAHFEEYESIRDCINKIIEDENIAPRALECD